MQRRALLPLEPYPQLERVRRGVLRNADGGACSHILIPGMQTPLPPYMLLGVKNLPAQVSSRDLAGLFTTATLRAMASPSPWEAARRLMNAGLMSARAPLADVLDEAYISLVANRPSEYIFKNTLISKIVFGRHRPSTAAATIELPVGASIADVLIVNGTSTIYEIKSDLDSFSRLSSQLTDYSRLAENVYLVTSTRRAKQASVEAPSHIGLLTIDKRGRIGTIREAEGGIERLEPRYFHDVLRTSERKLLLSRAGFDPIGMTASDLKHSFCHLTPDVLHNLAVTILRERFSSPAALVTCPKFPVSLRALAYGTPLSPPAQKRLATRLSRFPSQMQLAV